MKKHLIAAAVAGALAVPAMAQVTVSGYLESGLVNKEVAGTGAAVGDKVKQTSLGNSPMGTTNIKFSGSEDLGGGLKASFTLQKDVESSAGQYTNDSFQVAAIGLSGGFGSVTLGRQSDGGQEAGAAYRFFGDFGRTSMRDGSYETNSIQYVTPAMSGFTVGVFSKMDGKSTADANGGKATSVYVKGALGPLSLGVSHQAYNTTGLDTDDDVRQGVSAAYDLGMAKVGVGYLTLKDESADETTKFTAVHVMAPLGGALSVGLAYNQYKDDADTATQTVLQAKYALSKRTSVNFAYETVKTDDSGVPNGIGTATNGIANAYVAGETTTGYALSVSHSF
jgi:predicted porin